MWKDDSLGYGKKNRTSGISLMAAAFIASLFLSMLCCLSYNFWVYEIEQIILEEGDWEGRITGELEEEKKRLIEKFANVEQVKSNAKASEQMGEAVTDLYFRRKGSIYQDMEQIADKLELTPEEVFVHELLLSRYLVSNPQDETPPLLLPFFLMVVFLASLSLILIIHNSFAISMNDRIHQLGIFSSVGATPGQIRIGLLREAGLFCAVPILAGSAGGVLFSFGILQGINGLGAQIEGRHEAVFQYLPLILALTLFASGLTVFLSAWIPASRLSRLTPLEAIRTGGEAGLKRKNHSLLLPKIFGVEGELAGNGLRARKKALRTSTISLTLSFLAFSMMLCFFTLSGISTGHTYFERYQDTWDVMAEVKNQTMETFDREKLEQLKVLPEAESTVIYQKAWAVCRVPAGKVSRQVAAAGGLEAIAGESIVREGDDYLVQAPLVILDDESFAEYCEQIQAEPSGGAVVLNRIWDSVNSNFRYKAYIPFLTEEAVEEGRLLLEGRTEKDGKTLELPVAAFTDQAPRLREEYENYSLVQFIPLSLWEQKKEALWEEAQAVYVRVLAGRAEASIDAEPQVSGKDQGKSQKKDGENRPEGSREENQETGLEPSLWEEAFARKVEALEEGVRDILGSGEEIVIENRIEEKRSDDAIRKGSTLLFGGFCGLLAVIGIANVFSNTLGFLRQRKREFARYLSVGMTPAGMRKLFFVEALVIAGKPALITLPLSAVAAAFMIKASYLDPGEFLAKAPIVPMLLFILCVFAFVALAYYLGGRKILACDLSDALQDDSLM